MEFNGNQHNNICQTESDDFDLTRVDDFLSVIHEPNPERRYKAAFIVHVPWERVQGGVRDVGDQVKRCQEPLSDMLSRSSDSAGFSLEIGQQLDQSRQSARSHGGP